MVILGDCDRRISSPAKISIQLVEPPLQIAFRIGAGVTHGNIVLLTRSSLIGQQDVLLFLCGEHVVKVMAEQLIPSDT